MHRLRYVLTLYLCCGCVLICENRKLERRFFMLCSGARRRSFSLGWFGVCRIYPEYTRSRGLCSPSSRLRCVRLIGTCQQYRLLRRYGETCLQFGNRFLLLSRLRFKRFTQVVQRCLESGLQLGHRVLLLVLFLIGAFVEGLRQVHQKAIFEFSDRRLLLFALRFELFPERAERLFDQTGPQLLYGLLLPFDFGRKFEI